MRTVEYFFHFLDSSKFAGLSFFKLFLPRCLFYEFHYVFFPPSNYGAAKMLVNVGWRGVVRRFHRSDANSYNSNSIFVLLFD